MCTEIEIKNILTCDFDFHGFSRYGEEHFTVLCQSCFTKYLKTIKQRSGRTQDLFPLDYIPKKCVHTDADG